MHFISSFFIAYMIILVCYLHCCIDVLHVLDDLWDFRTKSLFLEFNLGGRIPPFLVFIVSGVSRTQIIKGKIPRQFFFGRRAMERRPKRGRPRGPNGVGPRGQVQGPRGTHQTRPRALSRLAFFMYAFVFSEKRRPNFLRII